ncbi:unnamed protein product [Pylaiella littoralis]
MEPNFCGVVWEDESVGSEREPFTAGVCSREAVKECRKLVPRGSLLGGGEFESDSLMRYCSKLVLSGPRISAFAGGVPSGDGDREATEANHMSPGNFRSSMRLFLAANDEGFRDGHLDAPPLLRRRRRLEVVHDLLSGLSLLSFTTLAALLPAAFLEGNCLHPAVKVVVTSCLTAVLVAVFICVRQRLRQGSDGPVEIINTEDVRSQYTHLASRGFAYRLEVCLSTIWGSRVIFGEGSSAGSAFSLSTVRTPEAGNGTAVSSYHLRHLPRDANVVSSVIWMWYRGVSKWDSAPPDLLVRTAFIAGYGNFLAQGVVRASNSGELSPLAAATLGTVVRGKGVEGVGVDPNVQELLGGRGSELLHTGGAKVQLGWSNGQLISAHADRVCHVHFPNLTLYIAQPSMVGGLTRTCEAYNRSFSLFYRSRSTGHKYDKAMEAVGALNTSCAIASLLLLGVGTGWFSQVVGWNLLGELGGLLAMVTFSFWEGPLGALEFSDPFHTAVSLGTSAPSYTKAVLWSEALGGVGGMTALATGQVSNPYLAVLVQAASSVLVNIGMRMLSNKIADCAGVYLFAAYTTEIAVEAYLVFNELSRVEGCAQVILGMLLVTAVLESVQLLVVGSCVLWSVGLKSRWPFMPQYTADEIDQTPAIREGWLSALRLTGSGQEGGARDWLEWRGGAAPPEKSYLCPSPPSGDLANRLGINGNRVLHTEQQCYHFSNLLLLASPVTEDTCTAAVMRDVVGGWSAFTLSGPGKDYSPVLGGTPHPAVYALASRSMRSDSRLLAFLAFSTSRREASDDYPEEDPVLHSAPQPVEAVDTRGSRIDRVRIATERPGNHRIVVTMVLQMYKWLGQRTMGISHFGPHIIRSNHAIAVAMYCVRAGLSVDHQAVKDLFYFGLILHASQG